MNFELACFGSISSLCDFWRELNQRFWLFPFQTCRNVLICEMLGVHMKTCTVMGNKGITSECWDDRTDRKRLRKGTIASHFLSNAFIFFTSTVLNFDSSTADGQINANLCFSLWSLWGVEDGEPHASFCSYFSVFFYVVVFVLQHLCGFWGFPQ